MTCKEDYDKMMKDVTDDAKNIRHLKRDEIIKQIKDNIEFGGTYPLKGNFSNFTDDDIVKILSGLKTRDWIRKEDSVLCKCIRNDGLNQDNANEIIGEKNSRFARNALKVLSI